MRYIWMGVGFLCLALGALGIVLPLLPTVVFWILAAFAFSKSSDRLHAWMMTHPQIGPPLVDWFENGGISKRAKRAATIAICLTVLISFFLGMRFFLISIQILVLSGVLVFIWSRPDA